MGTTFSMNSRSLRRNSRSKFPLFSIHKFGFYTPMSSRAMNRPSPMPLCSKRQYWISVVRYSNTWASAELNQKHASVQHRVVDQPCALKPNWYQLLRIFIEMSVVQKCILRLLFFLKVVRNNYNILYMNAYILIKSAL